MSADSGMALAILVAMALMASIPGVVLGALGYLWGRRRRRRDPSARAPWLLGLLGFGLGVAGGLLAIVFTFYESTFDPEMVFETPDDFEHHAIFVVEDPSSSRSLDWDVTHMQAHLRVPGTGVVRISDLEDFVGGPLNARLASGEPNRGASARPPPAPLPGRSVLCFSFESLGDPEVSDCGRQDVAELIADRERGP